jgi:hypothetical protein
MTLKGMYTIGHQKELKEILNSADRKRRKKAK